MLEDRAGFTELPQNVALFVVRAPVFVPVPQRDQIVDPLDEVFRVCF